MDEKVKALAAAEGIIKALKLYCWDGAEYVLKRDAIAAEILKHFPAEAAVPVSELMQALIKVANETASPMGSDSLSLAGKRLTMLENDIHKLIHRYQPAGDDNEKV